MVAGPLPENLLSVTTPPSRAPFWPRHVGFDATYSIIWAFVAKSRTCTLISFVLIEPVPRRLLSPELPPEAVVE